MVLYNCEKCNFTTYHKSVYTKHLNRKNPCKKVSTEIAPNCTEIAPNCTEIAPNYTEITPNFTENIKKELSRITCNYCLNTFTRNSCLTRHLKLNCKMKKRDNLEKETIYQQLLNEHLNIKNENETIKTKLIKIEKKLSKNKTINNNNNNTNNINNGTINNIQIVAHGKEDLSQIKENVIIQLVKRGWRSVPMFTEYLHCNDKFPEQKNIYINDINRQYCMVYNGIEWLLKDKTVTIDELYQTKYDFLEENFNTYYDQLEDYQQQSFKKFIKLNEEDKPFVRKIKEELKTLLYNKRNKILNNL
jgi:hypothetical protein